MILDAIIAAKRAEIAQRRAQISMRECRAQAENAPPPRHWVGAIRNPSRAGNPAGLCCSSVALIAEIKPASPSRGALRTEIEPAQLACTFAQNGAAALSVLTEQHFFKGTPENLAAARRATTLPVLRKDFILDEYQVYETRAWQADALLLLVQLLDDVQLRDYRLLAESLGLATLVEVHDERELERALFTGATLIGINNRNLADFRVDLATTERLAPLIPKDKILVSESGIFTRADVERVAQVGVDAVLVGEALMRAKDVAAKTRELATVAKRSTVLEA